MSAAVEIRGAGRRAWTDAELGFLLSPPRGWSRQDIADYLGRSVKTVRVYQNKLRRGWAPQRAWMTDDEIELIAATMDRYASDVAAQMGKSRSAVQQARTRLRRAGRVGATCVDPKRPQPYEVGTRTLLAKTCADCGLLWGGGEFSNAGHSYGPTCNRCRNRRRRSSREGANVPYAVKAAALEAVTESLSTRAMPYRSRSGQPWTGREIKLLARRDLTTPAIAAQIGRSWQAVSAACKRYDVRRPAETTTHLPTGEWRIEFKAAA